MKNFVMRGVMQFGVAGTDQPPHPCPPRCADPVVPYDHSAAIGRQNPTPVRPTRENRYDANSGKTTTAIRPVTAMARQDDQSAAIRPQIAMPFRPSRKNPYDAKKVESTLPKKSVTHNRSAIAHQATYFSPWAWLAARRARRRKTGDRAKASAPGDS